MSLITEYKSNFIKEFFYKIKDKYEPKYEEINGQQARLFIFHPEGKEEDGFVSKKEIKKLYRIIIKNIIVKDEEPVPIKIIFEEGITELKRELFKYRENTYTVRLNQLFWNFLMAVELPSSLKSIDSGFFSHCEILKEVDFSKTSLKSLPSKLFYMSGLEKIKLPLEIDYIETSAFSHTPYEEKEREKKREKLKKKVKKLRATQRKESKKYSKRIKVEKKLSSDSNKRE